MLSTERCVADVRLSVCKIELCFVNFKCDSITVISNWRYEIINDKLYITTTLQLLVH